VLCGVVFFATSLPAWANRRTCAGVISKRAAASLTVNMSVMGSVLLVRNVRNVRRREADVNGAHGGAHGVLGVRRVHNYFSRRVRVVRMGVRKKTQDVHPSKPKEYAGCGLVGA